jgi:putative hydrolase of the HAD superfamily
MFRPMRQDKSQDFRGARPLAGPDFRHVHSWIFDLDNTLYPADGGLMDLLESRIQAFVQRELGLDPPAAWEVQKRYFREHGTTLAGLMRHHRTDPEAYLAFVNDIDVLTLGPNPQLRAALSRLPGERYVFTNNCGRYAERILTQLGIADLFADIWDVRVMGFTPKPARAAYDAVVLRSNIPAASAAMFDDLIPNLEAAHALGMTTVWLRKPNQEVSGAAHIHHESDDLVSFLQSIEVSPP